MSVLDVAAGGALEWAAVVGSGVPRDAAFVVRSMLRRPGFAAVVVLTLALGIGANTAVFTLIDAVLLRPLPVSDPESLYAIYDTTDPAKPYGEFAYPIYRDLAAASRTVAGLAAYTHHDVSLGTADRSEIVSTAIVSGNYFTVLGITPQRGRLIAPADEGAPGSAPVAVISDDAWRRLFQRRESAVGSRVTLGATSFEIVGVAPPSFRGTDLTRTHDFWVPVTMVRGLDIGGLFGGIVGKTILTTFRHYGWLEMVARLRPGVTSADAAAELAAILSRLRPNRPGTASVEARVQAVPLLTAASIADREGVLRFSQLLLAVVGLILLLACVNVAYLLLMRSAWRSRELGVAAAIGATRARLLGHLLLESLVLAVAGGVVGVAIGSMSIRLLSAFSLPGGIRIDSLDLSLDARVLAFTMGLSILTTVLFGLVPALRASRVDPASMFHLNVRASTVAPRGGWMAAQIAISVVILVACGLFLRSLRAGLDADLWFDPALLGAATIELRLQGYDGNRVDAFYAQVLERLRATEGVTAAGLSTHVPPAPLFRSAFKAADAEGEHLSVARAEISAGFVGTLGLRLVAGRDFNAEESKPQAYVPGGTTAVIVNEAAAKQFWPRSPAVGRHLVDWGGRAHRVVGVVSDSKYSTLRDETEPFVFVSALQIGPSGRMHVVARAEDPRHAAAAVRRAIAAVDPRVPVTDVRLVRDQVDTWLMPQRFGAVLLSAFAALAVAVASVGFYATLAYGVACRRTELGIRLALGARRSDIVRTVTRRTGGALAAGLGAGVGGALLAGRGVQHFLFGVSPRDGAAMLFGVLVLCLALALAALAPLRRAVAIEPLSAIRSE